MLGGGEKKKFCWRAPNSKEEGEEVEISLGFSCHEEGGGGESA